MSDLAVRHGFQPLFNSLEGEWLLTRDYSTGERFEGTASFKSAGKNRFRLMEVGHIQLKTGRKLGAIRNWYWTFRGPASLQIQYHEKPPRLYHQIDLTKLTGQEVCWSGTAHHLCGQDTYDGEYRFEQDQIIIRHRVNGPAKDYRFEARFRGKNYSNERTGSPDDGPRSP